MTEKKKTRGLAITYAPQFATRLFNNELKKDKNGSFIIIYQQGETDSTGDKIYKIGLYKMVWYAPIRTDAGLAEVLDFMSQNKNVQILDADAYEKTDGAK